MVTSPEVVFTLDDDTVVNTVEPFLHCLPLKNFLGTPDKTIRSIVKTI